MRAILPIGLVVLSGVAAAEGRPSVKALREAFAANHRNLVQVTGPRKTGPGIFVGSSGHVLTSVDYVSMTDATVEFEGRRMSAKVVMANADLKVAVLKVDEEGEYPATPVSPARVLKRGTWVLALVRSPRGQPRAVVGRVTKDPPYGQPFVEIDLPLPPGTPLFDRRGQLVAVAVQRRSGAGSRALPIPAVKLQLAGENAL